MKVTKLDLCDFRLFNNAEVYIGKKITAIAGNNGTGKSTILGLLANSSALKNRRSLLDKPYRGEFSELFSADKEHDPAGKKVRLEYEERGVNRLVEFRTAWQKGDRFRVIPRRVRADGTKTESKVESPVIYLGLSRLYPVGEATSAVTAKNHRWKDPEDGKWFNSNYARILSIHDEIRSVSSLSISDVSSKRGMGVETDSYGPVANSAGQDNLGQILLAVLSFKRLRMEMGAEWDGGILLIDEVDAALHPAAQLRLVKLLFEEAGTTGFQVVFTTHSTVILEELSKKNQHNPSDAPGDVEISYLSIVNGLLLAVRNPTWTTMKHGLYVTNPALSSKRVGTFAEDPEARWLIRGILDALRPDVLDNVDLLEVSLGCEQIMSLYTGDFAYFRDRVVVLDGDVSQAEIAESIPPALLKSGGNVVRLPGEERPENVIWNYLLTKPVEGSPLWSDLWSVGITWESLVESPPNTLFPGESERNRYKRWLRKYENLFNRASVIKHWTTDNPDMANRFVDDFIKAYNNVAKRVGAPTMSMRSKIS